MGKKKRNKCDASARSGENRIQALLLCRHGCGRRHGGCRGTAPDPDQAFKTLVTVGKSGEHYVFVIPVNQELDLKKAAEAAGEKSIAMIKSKELLPLTGYIHGGCSPLGMKKQFRTFFHQTANGFETIMFSAGKIGYQVEVSPEALRKILKYETCDLVKE